MTINLSKIGGRGTQSFIISVFLHLILAILAGFYMLSQEQVRKEVFTSIDILKSVPDKIRNKPSPPRRKFSAKKVASKTQVSGSVHKVSEVIEYAHKPVVSDANLEEDFQKNEIIPDVTTIAKKLRTSRRDIRISGAVSTGNKPTPGDGILSFRQRAGGSGKGQGQGGSGLGLEDTVGAEELDTNVLEETEAPKEPLREITPYGEALGLIGEHIAGNSLTGSVDVVFVMDTSMSMQDNIDKVANNLYNMIEAYDKYGITYRFGVVEFSVRKEGNKIDIARLTNDVGILQSRMKHLSLSGDEHALDALAQTLTNVEFSSGSDKNLILVTDEPASTSWNAPDAYPKLRSRIISESKSSQIAVSVLGANRSFQRRLANETGGIWVEIPGGERDSLSTSSSKDSKDRTQKAKLMRAFRKIAQNINRKTNRTEKGADIVIAVDFSSSMGTKAPLVINGIHSILKILNFAPLEHRIGMIRFATGSTVEAVEGVFVTNMLSENDKILSLLQSPFGGDENLLDAVVEGIPKINFSNTERFLVIVTDEPSTGNYTTEEALEVCKEYSLEVSVVGALPEDVSEEDFDFSVEIQNDDFQFQAVNQTGGIFYPMPNSLKHPDSNR